MKEVKQLSVSAIRNGTVIDHVPARSLFKVITILGLDKFDNQITFGTNLMSEKLGKKAIIKVSNKTLAAQLGATNKYITIEQLFDAEGNYGISENVQAANAKTPALRNRVEKEYIYVDERVNICFMIFN